MPRIIVPLDVPTIDQARDLVAQLDPTLCRLKIGNILFTRYGPGFVEELMKKDFDVFLDLKFHDIPQTVAGACRSAAELGVWMINVHIQGGRQMLMTARDEIEQWKSDKKPLLIGVTVLTSLDDEDLEMMGNNNTVINMVLHLAEMAQESGLDGVVCSAQEAAVLRQQCGPDFVLVTPGIRLADDAETDDQKRVMTPAAAVTAGADYLVIGRAITQSNNPLKTLKMISADVDIIDQT